MVYDGEGMYVHLGGNVMKYTAFPDTATFFEIVPGGHDGMHVVSQGVNNAVSESFVFKDRVYILDGQEYSFIEDGDFSYIDEYTAFIPTTRIGSDPGGYGGEAYQEENVLTPFRKNTFLSDGTSMVYVLDYAPIAEDSVSVHVNGREVILFTVDSQKGKVIFPEPLPLPLTEGADNVTITFSTGISRRDRIDRCTVAKVFDNRAFLSGNPLYPGVIFHSAFEDAAYFPISGYYDDGEDNIPVKSLMVSGGRLVVLKETGGNGGKVFIHTPVIDYDLGKVYPVTDTQIYFGAAGCGTNYGDELIYLSDRGIESLRIGEGYVRLSHRSSFIDERLKKYTIQERSSSKMIAFKDNLILIIGGDVFITDGILRENVKGDGQYEWFYWKFAMEYEKITGGICVGGEMYFYSDKGNIFVYDGYYDDGYYVKSFWKTPKDHLGTEGYLKSFARKGNYITANVTDFSEIIIHADTDNHEKTLIGRFSLSPFGFTGMNFGKMSFFTGGKALIPINNLPRRFGSISFEFSSDKSPFNISGIAGEYHIKKYD